MFRCGSEWKRTRPMSSITANSKCSGMMGLMSDRIRMASAATGKLGSAVGIEITASGRVVVHDQIDSSAQPSGHVESVC